jgi:hypothetical protein
MLQPAYRRRHEGSALAEWRNHVCFGVIAAARSRRRVAEAAAEHAIEMGHIAKAGRAGDVGDREMQAARVGQHRKTRSSRRFARRSVNEGPVSSSSRWT